MSDSPRLFVHLLPALIPPGALDGQVAIVVDVLRATTVIVRALASGCREVRPCLEIEEAQGVAGTLPEGSAVLAGERQGLPIPGFDLGNSPGDFTPDRVGGRVLVMTTTNGTRAIRACLPASAVFVAAFLNLEATARAAFDASSSTRSLHIVASGTDGRISFEDTLLAGALAGRLESFGLSPGNDESRIALALWSHHARQIEQGTPLEQILRLGRGGQRVEEIGLAADLISSSQQDSLPLVVQLLRSPDRLVSVLS